MQQVPKKAYNFRFLLHSAYRLLGRKTNGMPELGVPFPLKIYFWEENHETAPRLQRDYQNIASPLSVPSGG
jgi:hypothetical protein